jgi:hypothetical protein
LPGFKLDHEAHTEQVEGVSARPVGPNFSSPPIQGVSDKIATPNEIVPEPMKRVFLQQLSSKENALEMSNGISDIFTLYQLQTAIDGLVNLDLFLRFE